MNRKAYLVAWASAAVVLMASVWVLPWVLRQEYGDMFDALARCPAAPEHEAKCTPCVCGTPPGSPPLAAAEFVPRQFETCNLTTLGGRDGTVYGSWPLCLNHVPDAPIVYSVGIGGDVSFDADMIRRGAQVFAFDPTIGPDTPARFFFGENATLRNNFTFMQVGLGPTNGVRPFFRAKDKRIGSLTAVRPEKMKQYQDKEQMLAATLTLRTLMAIHMHNHIDLLKVDIEGVEFELCDNPGFVNSLRQVEQLLFEFHDRLMHNATSMKERCIVVLAGEGFSLTNSTNAGEHVFARMKQH